MNIICDNPKCPNNKNYINYTESPDIPNWDLRFLNIAKHISTWSKDPSSKVGAVITKGKVMIASGFNGFPKNTDDNPEIYKNREQKYLRIIHAEINAILYSKCDLSGCTLYCTLPPCCQCTAAIIQSGITKVIHNKPDKFFIERWKDSLKESKAMFSEAGVEVIEY
jgi:dCMP deaminase